MSAQNNGKYFIQMCQIINLHINIWYRSIKQHALQTQTSPSLRSCSFLCRQPINELIGTYVNKHKQVNTGPDSFAEGLTQIFLLFAFLSSESPMEGTIAWIIPYLSFAPFYFFFWLLLLYSRSSWQATIQPTMGQKPPWQTKVLISLIINQ